MKNAVLILFCAFALTSASNDDVYPNGCPKDWSVEKLFPHNNCNKFYQCWDGELVEHTCPSKLFFSIDENQCEWAEEVDCTGREIPDDKDDQSNENGGGSCNCNPESPGNCNCENCDCNNENEGGTCNCNPDEGTEDCDNGGNDNDDDGNGGGGTCNCNPGEAPEICAADNSDGILIAHEKCNHFYICDGGKPVAVSCPDNLLFNPHTEQCDWPENVDCGDRVIPDNDCEDNENGDNDNGGGSCNCNPESPGNCNCENCDCNNENEGGTCNCNPDEGSGGDDNGGNDNDDDGNGGGGTCNCNPGEAPEICAADNSDGILIAHEKCNHFYICDGGKPVAVSCPDNLLFNPHTEQCDWPENVDCGDRVIPDNDCEDNENGDNDNGGGSCNCNPESPGNCNCENCDCNNENEGGTCNCNPDEGSGGDDNGGNDNDDDGNGGGGTCNCNPGEAPEICAADNSDGILIAHEKCNRFYICDGGKPVAVSCPDNLLFNPHTEQCDWPENVDCGDRVIPDNDCEDKENGDNDNGGGSCNCNPESPGNCNCENCDCNNENEGGTCNCNPDEGSGGDDNGGNDNDDDGNGGGGTCNCNPGEAPEICAADNSDGILIAHEKCNHFYICDGGKPVAVSCPDNLLFNPHTEQCDWPENVDCGDRVIPDNNCEDNENGDNDNGGGSCNCNPESPGNCNCENCDCNNENEGGTCNCNPDEGSGGDDNGGNDNDDDGNGGGGTCNCNPGEAPEICAADNSDGILIAHEKCNRFYICDGGKPVAVSCPDNLLFNPHTEQCDWPENVDCGDRVIPDNDCEDKENGDNDNGGGSCNCNPESPGNCNCENCDCNNENEGGTCNCNPDEGTEDCNNGGDGDNDNGGGSCNCNPEEAPAICAADDSDGVLVAHESCNKFYICDGGKPVAVSCPNNLLFNPHTEQCDWPENVDCGDRVIPDNDCEDKENGDNDNGGGSCNCNPESPGNCNCENCDCNNENEGGTCNCNPDEGNGGDNGGNGNGDDGNGGGTCNCNPEEAPAICAAEDSDSILVAHEDCNKFYICSAGRPVAMRCPESLYFNPFTNKCDWAENVQCDRNKDTSEETDDSCIQSNDGAGNDDPRQAQSICAADDSNGVLVAHENCNKFYICDNGTPVARTCPANLLFNPRSDKCDWPQCVTCNDRVHDRSDVAYKSFNKHLQGRRAIRFI